MFKFNVVGTELKTNIEYKDKRFNVRLSINI